MCTFDRGCWHHFGPRPPVHHAAAKSRLVFVGLNGVPIDPAMLRRTRRHATWPADVWRSEWNHDTLPHSAVGSLRLLPTTAGTLAAKASQGVDAKTVIDVVQTAPGKFNVVVRVSGLDTSSMKAGKLSSMTRCLKQSFQR